MPYELRLRIEADGQATVISETDAGAVAPVGAVSSTSVNFSQVDTGEAKPKPKAAAEPSTGRPGLSRYDARGVYQSALGRVVDAMTDPMISGARQRQTIAVESARAGTYRGMEPLRRAAAPLGREAEVDAQALSAAVADRVAAGVQLLMQRHGATGEDANAIVQSVAAQQARAGVPITDENLDALLARQTAQAQAAYDAQARVASRSGNVFARSIAEAQAAADATASGVGGLLCEAPLPESPEEWDSMRRGSLTELDRLAHRATFGG